MHTQKSYQRRIRFVLVASAVVGSWLGMQAVHELGHAAAARLTGGQVERVVLHPLTISRTDLARNPRPLAVVWAGPLVGVLLPLALWGAAWAARLPGAFVMRFFAGFCLLANGAYIGAGSFDGVGDCGEMLRHGSPMWLLWLFGLACLPAGLWLWHGLGADFGLGPAPREVRADVAYTCLVGCALLLTLGFVVGGR
jgi:hypothetical protein